MNPTSQKAIDDFLGVYIAPDDRHGAKQALLDLLAEQCGPSEGACAKAIREHNEGCDGACEGRRPTAKDDSGGCGYQRSDGSLIYSRRCPECPKDWKIEVPASEAGEDDGGRK